MCAAKSMTPIIDQGGPEASCDPGPQAQRTQQTQSVAGSGAGVGLDDTQQARQEAAAEARRVWVQTRLRHPALGMCRR
jgi:hypothetical protein